MLFPDETMSDSIVVDLDEEDGIYRHPQHTYQRSVQNQIRDTTAKRDINLIAAVGRNGQLGLHGKLPWHDSEDLRWFKSMTMGDIVVVGWKTYQTLPALPGRTVVIDDHHRPVPSILENLKKDPRTIWVAGGAKTYARWIPFIRRSLVTHIDYDGPSDVWMPQLWGTAQ